MTHSTRSRILLALRRHRREHDISESVFRVVERAVERFIDTYKEEFFPHDLALDYSVGTILGEVVETRLQPLVVRWTLMSEGEGGPPISAIGMDDEIAKAIAGEVAAEYRLIRAKHPDKVIVPHLPMYTEGATLNEDAVPVVRFKTSYALVDKSLLPV